MNKFITSVGATLLLICLSLSFLISCGGWANHLLLLMKGDWRPLNKDDSVQTLVQNPPLGLGLFEEPVMKVEGDISGVEKVLMTSSEPEVSVYIDVNGNVIAAQLGIASVLRRLSPWEIAVPLMLIGISLFLVCIRENMQSRNFRLLGLLLMIFSLCDLSTLLLAYYPLHTLGIITGLSIFLIAFFLAVFTLAILLSGKRQDNDTSSERITINKDA